MTQEKLEQFVHGVALELYKPRFRRVGDIVEIYADNMRSDGEPWLEINLDNSVGFIVTQVLEALEKE